MSNNGTLCYGYDGEIYTQQGGSAPQKVQIEITRDDPSQVEYLNYTNGATSATVSPDGKQIGFIIRGEVFVTSADYATTKQITRTPANESGLSFAPDNRTLAYASERNGNWQLYLAKIARKEDPNFPNATIIKEEVLLLLPPLSAPAPSSHRTARNLLHRRPHPADGTQSRNEESTPNNRRLHLVQHKWRVQLCVVAGQQMVHSRIYRQQT